MNESIWLYSLDSGKATRVTDDWHTDWSPSFSPDGDYLYLPVQPHFAPVMGKQDQNHVFLDMTRPYLVLLREGMTSPFAEQDVLVGGDDDEKAEDDDKDGATPIDLEGIGERVLVCAGVEAGTYFRLTAVDGGFRTSRRTVTTS